ncbi:MAG: DUF3644 domain-containing protein [Terracidiphilus sp.]
MNYRSSHRKLLGNGKAALLSAVEIYNKPRICYRDECFVILLLNAWELILKALLSKNDQSIFYPKRRKEPYRTYSLADAFRRAEPFIPAGLVLPAVRLNLELLSTYRDNAVHFYNAQYFGSVIYALAQTSIMNLRDLLKEAFGADLSEDITWQILPLGFAPPIDPVDYMSGRAVQVKQSKAVKQFLARIAESAQMLKSQHLDTGRLLTVFKVKLESTKKIGNAEIVVGVQGPGDGATGPLVVTRAVDPNITHPLRTKELVAAVGLLHGQQFTTGAFQAVAWKLGIKSNPSFCWRSSMGELVKYSNETVAFIKRLTSGDVELAKTEYRERNRKKKYVVPATAAVPIAAGQQLAAS